MSEERDREFERELGLRPGALRGSARALRLVMHLAIGFGFLLGAGFASLAWWLIR